MTVGAVVVGENGSVEPAFPSPLIQVRPGSYPLADYSPWKGKFFPVFCISVDSFLDVYLQLNGDETNRVLDMTSDYIKSLPKDEPIKPFPKTVGTPCLAFYEQDEFWYRARISEDLGNGVYQVYFVDYGNTTMLREDQVMACPDSLVRYAEGITKVALNGFTGDESDAEVEILRDLMQGKDFKAKIDCLNFEIKGKNRMLLSLFDFDDMTAMKTKFEQALKAQRDAGRADLKEDEQTLKFTQLETFHRTNGEDTSKDEQAVSAVTDPVASPLEIKSAGADSVERAALTVVSSDVSCASSADDKTDAEGKNELNVVVTGNAPQAAQVASSPTFTYGSKGQQSMAEVSTTSAPVESAARLTSNENLASSTPPTSPMKIPRSLEAEPVSLTMNLTAIPTQRFVRPTSMKSVPLVVAEDALDGIAPVAHSPTVAATFPEITKDATDAVLGASTSDRIAEQVAKENHFRQIEAELRLQIKELKKAHENEMSEASAQLHKALMSKSCALAKVKELESQLQETNKTLGHTEAQNEALQIENAKLIQRNNELQKLNNELSAKLQQHDEECGVKQVRFYEERARWLAEKEALQNGIRTLSAQIQDLQKENSQLRDEFIDTENAAAEERNIQEAECAASAQLKSELEKAQVKNTQLQGRCEELEARSNLLLQQYKQLVKSNEDRTFQYEGLVKVNENLKNRCEQLMKSNEDLKVQCEEFVRANNDLKVQHEQLMQTVDNYEKQMEGMSAAESTQERRGSGSGSGLLLSLSATGTQTQSMFSEEEESLVAKQKKLILQLSQTLDAALKLNAEESEQMQAKLRAKDAKIAELLSLQGE